MSTSAIILAGGEGKRMKSGRPKVLSEVLFEPMIRWVMDTVREAGIDSICVVKGSKKEFLEEYISTLPFEVETVFQSERLGTGHAVMTALPFLEKHKGEDVLILNGDAPFVSVDTIKNALSAHLAGGAERGCTVISAELDEPKGYGRIVHEENDPAALMAIVEEKEADDEIRKIKEVNSGAYWFSTDVLTDALGKLTKSEKTGEYYLTDTVGIIKKTGKKTISFVAENADSVLGANDCIQLAQLNEIARIRILHKHMAEGVNIPCTDGVIIGKNVQIGANTVILPATVIKGDAKIGSFCEIGPAAFIDSEIVSDRVIIRK